MATIFTAIHIVACVVIILFVMLQSGRGAEAGAMFGGSNSNSVFGGAGPASFLVKVTAAAGLVFFLTSLGLTMIGSSERGSVLDRIDVAEELGDKPESNTPAPVAAAMVSGAVTFEGDASDVQAWVTVQPGDVRTIALGGRYSVSVPDPSSHTIEVTAAGFAAATTQITLQPGGESSADFVLQPAGQ